MQDAAAGLDHLHAAGLQHRDVKPQNLLRVGGRVKVGDLGLAKALPEGAASHTGRMTPAYAAPEFLQGQTSAHSDQYSLAVSWCQLRGGRLPFAGTPAQVVAGHLHGTADLTMLPGAERPVVARALAREPARRWPTCRAFIESLRQAQAPAAQDSAGGQRSPAGKRRLVAAAVLLLLLGLGAVSLGRLVKGPEAPAREEAGPAPATPARPEEMRILGEHGGPVHAVALAPVGRLAASAGEDRQVLVWELPSGRLFQRLRGHTSSVRCVAFSPDGSRLLSGGGLGDGRVVVWDVGSGREMGRLEGHEHGRRGVAVLPDGRRAVSCSLDGTIRLWDLPKRREVGRFEGFDRADTEPPSWGRQVWCLALSGDGTRLACGVRDGSVRIFDVATHRQLHRLTGHLRPVNAVACSADGGRVLSACGNVLETGDPPDSTVRLWDGREGRAMNRWPSPVGGAWAVALLPDARQGLLGGEDGALALLDLESGRTVHRLEGHAGTVTAACVSGDSRMALSGGADRTVRLWRLP